MANNIKKTVNLLPEYLKSDKNAKFLASTIDQLIQSPELERIDGFVGSKITPNYNPTTDFYVPEVLPLRKEYPLEPALVFKDEFSNITDVVAFDDIVNEIGIQGGKNNNIDRLFRTKFYSYDPFINWDKLVNYTQYYWLPTGPLSITITTPLLDVNAEIVGQSAYLMPNGYFLSNGMKITFLNDVIPASYKGNEYIVEGVGTSIKLIDFKLLNVQEAMASTVDETFDTTPFDTFPFDGDGRLPLDPEYITINRASNDLNPWSRYNRWFHKEVIETSAAINNQAGLASLTTRAKRPIIEFVANIQLYNFGKTGIKNVDLIDKNQTTAFSTINNSYGYYVDGIRLEQGNTVIFNNDADPEVCGQIYRVNFANVAGDSPRLQLILDTELVNFESVAINSGNVNAGTSWYYNASIGKWIFAQQHTTLNQAPLFDLFDSAENSYSDSTVYQSNFSGCKIFGYDIGTGTSDAVLGFPLKYKNIVGSGSYLFRNYFMTDSITVITNRINNTISTSVTLVKVNEQLANVWADSADYQIPVLEIQSISASTSSLILTSFNNPITLPDTIVAYVNDIKIPTTFNKVGADIVVNAEDTFPANSTVELKITTSQGPNNNGYYETPLSLTNNPLNGNIATMTLSELSDHVGSMISRDTNFVGVFPGVSNLRDIASPSQFGTRLIISANPIAFAQMFLGKKEHNAVDAIRLAGDQYNQFKMNVLRIAAGINEQQSPSAALDIILADINATKDLKSAYYSSDMLGYGSDKHTITYTVSNVNKTRYSTNIVFDLKTLSFTSVLVYINGVQLVNNLDYTVDGISEEIVITKILAIDDIISIVCYNNTLGCFVPSTPTKLGLYPKFVPAIYIDTTYINGPVTVIQGHDGSIVPAYNDYRDAIILEFEKRIYNNIKVEYNPAIFDINAVLPGAFRNTGYTVSDTTEILIKDFIKWTGMYNINAAENSTVDNDNSFTWNYKGSFDTLTGNPLSGFWRGIYNYFYDTDRPHTHPWEMLGHFEKPENWDETYSWTEPTLRAALIDAIITGNGNNIYARPAFASIVPVNESGELLAPADFLTTAVPYAGKYASWVFGDQGPAESAWRKSSYWPFALNAAAALLDPCTYTSRLYDASRTKLNSLGQVTYLDDDLYLNPTKLIVPNNADKQIAGFGVYVIEKGTHTSQNYISALQQDLTYLNFNLFHKLGGFTSKDKLQITIDSINPTSASPGVVLPPEDYSLILNVSNPVKSASISGMIVQKYNGKFLIRGYDRTNPYFEIFNPIKTATASAITIGGVSEEFTDWTSGSNTGNISLSAIEITTANSVTTRYYKQGQLVRHNGKFYRIKVGHTAQSSFDPALFQGLPALPMTGGATVQTYTRFETMSTRVAYGTEFSTIQDVYDLIVGYGVWLESQGFVFDEFNADLNEIMDWRFTGKEFLYWTTQNWADNNLITLSPFAGYLKYAFTDSVVDDIAGGKYEYSLLKADGKSFPINNFTLSREDGVCTIKTSNTYDGLFFATLNSVQKEHAMVFNNTTMFNDTIYDIDTGYKQRRIKLSGFRTKNWNGDFSSPGFVYDPVVTTDWLAYTEYLPGKVVRYNGSYYESIKKIVSSATFDFSKWTRLQGKPVPQLLPNFDYKINQFEDFYSLDIDNFDLAQQQLAQHLVGYTPRVYLNNIFANPITQYKFYQGFIKEKGTKNAIDKFSKAESGNTRNTIEFKEEWAFRVGHYGAFESYNELEFTLNEATTLENPYVVKFVDEIPTNSSGLINYTTTADLLLTPSNYVAANTFTTIADTDLELTTAGYVRLDDVTATAYNKNNLLDIANNSLIQEGNTIWIGFLDNGDWSVYRYTEQNAKISGVYVSAPAESITFVTNAHHGLSIGDIVSVVRFNDQVNGVHVVTDITALNQFTVSSTLQTIVNANLINYGALFKFATARYDNFKTLTEVTDLLKLNDGEKLWIDSGVDNKWQVYEKIRNYSTATTIESIDSPVGQQLGSTVYSIDAAPIFLTSAPTWTSSTPPSNGKVWVYNKVNGTLVEQFGYTLNSTATSFCSTTNATDFGYSLGYDIGKELFFAGAPAASNVKAPLQTGVVTTTGTNIAKTFVSEGLVKISRRSVSSNSEQTEIVLVNPNATTSVANFARFGHSIYVNQAGTTGSAPQSTSQIIGFPATRSQVQYAYAANLRAELHPSDSTIRFWMMNGLDSFAQSVEAYRQQFPEKVAAIDAARAADNTGIVSSRAEVLYAYQNNPDAELYPTEEEIRYWMINGLGFNNSVFNESVITNNNANPLNHLMIIDQRKAEKEKGLVITSRPPSTNLPTTLLVGAPCASPNVGTGSVYAYQLTSFVSLRSEVIYAYALNPLAELYPSNDSILYWMNVGITDFDNAILYFRELFPEAAAMIDIDRAADNVNIVSTRAQVIHAYQANPDAQLYPSEEDIRYWMINGLGENNDAFSASVIATNLANPSQHAKNLAERAFELTSRTTITAHPSGIAVIPDSTITLNASSQWGHKISGNTNGTIIAISAPGYISDSTSGVVQIFNQNLKYIQTLNSPFNLIDKFGDDVAVSADGQYIVVSSVNASSESTPLGKVAVYNSTRLLASRPAVIYAYAANLQAELHPTEEEISYWMTNGLDGFDEAVKCDRNIRPADAASIDIARAADNKNILSTRAEVIHAYHRNPDAQLYPLEEDIRYWMVNGLGANYSTFNSSVTQRNAENPSQYAINLAERALVYPVFKYQATYFEVTYAYATNMQAELYPSAASIEYWMIHGLADFASTIQAYRISHPSEAITIDAARARDNANILSTRAQVLQAYENDPDVQEIPEETGIRWWMVNGLGDMVGFAEAVQLNKNLNPEKYKIFTAQRAARKALMYIYALPPAVYKLHQILDNPVLNYDLKFGYSMAISEDNNTLVISALGTNRSKATKFDVDSKVGNTTFDNGTTNFISAIPDSGSVYVYTRLGGYFIAAEELNAATILPGSRYGASLAIANNTVYVGAPSYRGIGAAPTTDDSKIYIFDKINTETNSLSILRQQEDLVNVSTVKRVALIDSIKEEIVEYLDVIDPLKGKIAGIAEQELSYKSAFDPATYSFGVASSVNDTETNWIDEHVGELWWDLSTAKYTWYEQGDETFRKNNWGKLFPGATIDVYEWVLSDMLPSDWAAIADTNEGLTRGISGQPKYPDNSVISVKQIFNNTTGAFENVYFFWVKNKVTVPNAKNRRISGYQVSRFISDPVADGLQFVEILSNNAIAFANVQPMLIAGRINANITLDTSTTDIPRHTEWLMLEENNANSIPTTLLEKKLLDSLVGYNSLGESIPANNLTYRNRYGIGTRPEQTMFKDKKEALRNQIAFANTVLLKNQIRDNCNLVKFNNKEEVPDAFAKAYDFKVEEISELVTASALHKAKTYVNAELQCFVSNGRIRSVVITNPGYGYTLPPAVIINGLATTNAEILTEIDSNGRVINAIVSNPGRNFTDAPLLIVRPHSALVKVDEENDNKWTIRSYDYNNATWVVTRIQQYDVTAYWKYVDWASEDFNQFKDYAFVIGEVHDLIKLVNANVGDYVKIADAGTGRFIILEKTNLSGNFAPSYNVVYSEKGTIQILDTIWNYTEQAPAIETAYILKGLKENIFVGQLKINWNLFFFKAVKYALTEQKLLDWAFKTSFINVINKVGTLDQRPVYKLDNDSYIEDYVKEVKPYHSQIRNFISKYEYIEDAALRNTDFDLPSYYNTLTQTVEVVRQGITSSEIFDSYPWKSWKDNYTSTIGSIIIANHGAGYTEHPVVTIVGGGPNVTINATAEAYIRSGNIYAIAITNPGAGYTQLPVVHITGGGPHITTTATASAVLNNFVTRKINTRIKFDRINPQSDIGVTRVSDTFICPGNTTKFTTSWLAEPEKLNIIPKLDGRPVLAADYTIEYYTKKYNGYSKKYSRFVFLNTVPAAGQVFKLEYNKNIELFTAVDRIKNLSTDTVASSMSGTEYPGTLLQGMPFEYSTPWNVTPYETTPWGDLTNYYASAKLVAPVLVGQTVLTLNTTTGIIPGQVIDLAGSAVHKFRTDTVVTSVMPMNNTIEISGPKYAIKSITSSGTIPGSTVLYKTKQPFNGDLIVGDIVTISGISATGYNGQYIISKIDGNNSFETISTNYVSTVQPKATVSSFATISSVLSSIDIQNEKLYSITTTVTNTSSTIVLTYTNVENIANIVVKSNGMTLREEEYSIIQDAEFLGKTALRITGLTPEETNVINVTLYGNPTIEFWKYDDNFAALDSIETGGTLGPVTISKTIDGDSFLSATASYAPEELVPGHVLDSLGINVYTKSEDSYATIITGAFGVNDTAPTVVSLGLIPNASMGILVNVDGKILNRTTNNADLSPDNFFVNGNELIIQPQGTPGVIRGGYTIVDAGGNGVIDNDIAVVTDVSTATVSSLSSINDIKRAYVMVDGKEINRVYSPSQYGYILEAVSSTNQRAAAKVYNLPAGQHTVEAWFFDSIYSQFNKVTEDIITIGTTTSTITLPHAISTVGPASSQVIVEVGPQNARRRLLAPWVSYYTVLNDRRTFAIDNKNTRPVNTYNIDNVKVYSNGVELRPGFDYAVNSIDSTVTLTDGVTNNDVLAIMGIIDYEFLISDNILQLATPIENNTVKITSFVNNAEMLIRTERFDADLSRRFTLGRPALNDSYVWVTLNGLPLIPRYDFEIFDDLKTIQLSEWVTINAGDDISVMSIDSPKFGNEVLGYRVFNDMVGTLHYDRLSKFHSTTLARDLHSTCTEIVVHSAWNLVSPNPAKNVPGVVLVNGERIEFFKKSGNVLSQLRRSTLGTGPAKISYAGTTVIDQSLLQTIPYKDNVLIQNTSTTNTTTYTISTVTTTATGAGIVLSLDAAAIDQLTVYYGGRQLRKRSVIVHDKALAYDTTSTSIHTLPPEFSINASTRELVLNISEPIVAGTRVTMVQKTGSIWTGTESILISDVPQADFIRIKEAELPNAYYYGGSTLSHSNPYEQ